MMNKYRDDPSKFLLKFAVPAMVIILVVTAGVRFLSASHAATICTVSSKLVNSCRPWLGAAVGKYPQVGTGVKAQAEYHEQRIGRRLDIVHTYHPVGNNTLSADDRYFATRSGTYLFANWKPAAKWSLASGSNASTNAGIDQMADSVKSLGSSKIFLTIHHEAENDVSGGAATCPATIYKGGYGTPADYRAMWRNVENRFAAKGVTNVVWVLDYMNYKPWDCLINDMYPGNDLVDWVMFNGYGGASGTYSSNVRHFYDFLTQNSTTARDYMSKPWGIVEWNDQNASESQGISYYNQAKASLDASEFPKLKAHMIFDSVGPDGNENRVAYTAGGVFSQPKQNAYTAFATDPRFTDAYYGTSVPDAPPTVNISTPSTGTVVGSNGISIAASARDDKAVSNVVFSYKASGASAWNTIGSADTAAPYNVDWRTSAVVSGTYDIRATAIDNANQTSVSPVVTVNVSNTTVIPEPPIAGCTISSKLVNSCRPWIGAWATHYPQVASGVRSQIEYHEQRIGRKVELVKDYKTQGGVLSADDKYFVSRSGTYAVVTWKPASDFGGAGGSNAGVNADIDKMADSVKSVGTHKIFLSLWHEPENDVSAGTSSCSAAKGHAGSPAQYRAMWQNVRNRFNARGVTNVVWAYLPMGYSGWTCMDKDLWPGNNLVDWIMWDPYGTSDKDNWDKSISSYYNWMTANSDATHDFNSKPWGLAETSSHQNSKVNAAKFWNDAKASLDANRYPKLKAYIVFDSDNGKPDNRIMYWCDPATATTPAPGGKGSCGHLEVDTNEQNAYAAFATDPRFTDAYYTSVTPPGDTVKPTVSITSPTSNSTINLVGAMASVVAAAKDNVGVTKVELYADHKLVSTAAAAPYVFTWNTKGTTLGRHELTAVAYDAAGNSTTSLMVAVTLTDSPASMPGDVNGDKKVNGLDYSLLVLHDGENYPPADFNHDGIVGAADLAILLSRWTW